MLMQWVEIVEAAGIAPRNLDALTVHLLAGKILKDSVVLKRRFAHAVGDVLPAGSTVKALRAMTNAERAELRERIQA